MNPVLLHAVRTAVFMSVCFSFYWLFLRKETFFIANRFYLIGTLFASVLFPFIRLENPWMVRHVTLSSSPMPAVHGVRMEPAVSAPDILLYIYLAGVLLYLSRMAWQFLHLHRLAGRNGTRKYRGFTIVFTDEEIAPFSFFHTIFINRSHFDEQNLDRILAHENIHSRQLHTVDCILVELYTAFQWFNPFVWPYKKSIKETHEYLADHAVIAQGCDRAGYQLLILEQVVGRELFELANNFHHSQIKRRITMMGKHPSRRLAIGKVLFSIPLVLVLLLAFGRPKVIAQEEIPARPAWAAPQDDKKTATADDKKKQEEEQKKQAELKAKQEDEKKKQAEITAKQEKQKQEQITAGQEKQQQMEQEAALKEMSEEDLKKKADYMKKDLEQMMAEQKEILGKFKEKMAHFKREADSSESGDKKAELEDNMKKLEEKLAVYKKESSVKMSQMKKKLAVIEHTLQEMQSGTGSSGEKPE